MNTPRTGTDPVDLDRTADSWRTLHRATGVAGLLGPVLVLGPISAASGQEPGFTGGAAAVLAFFRSTATPAHSLGAAVVAGGLVALLWFAVGLGLLLARAEGPPPWRSAIAVASAATFVILSLDGGWEAAAYRADGLTDALALYAFDEGNLTFANAWVAMGSCALCVGWVVLRTRWAPRWLGWAAVVSGVGLVLCRFVWTSSLWFLPYAVFWIWAIALSVRLLRVSRRVTPSSAVAVAVPAKNVPREDL